MEGLSIWRGLRAAGLASHRRSGAAAFILRGIIDVSCRFLTFEDDTGFVPMRVTSKGQVTIPNIPIAIRRQAGFLPNTEVDFDSEYVRICRAWRKMRPSEVARLIGRMRRHRGDVPMTTVEIMALMRGN